VADIWTNGHMVPYHISLRNGERNVKRKCQIRHLELLEEWNIRIPRENPMETDEDSR
jgi:hypothetical protein